MTELDENPYESPVAQPGRARRIPRFLTVLLAVPLTIIAACLAFAATCFPVAQIGIKVSGAEASMDYEGVMGIAVFAGFLGIGVGIIAGVLTWKVLTRRRS